MYLCLANEHMQSGNYERAVQSLEDARIKVGNRGKPPLMVSLVYP